MRRVVLYKNGVGYFEHVGRVTGDEDIAITFTSAQLDDALKSLTALDLGGGRIGGISYNSVAPLAQRVAGLPFAFGEKADHLEFFRGLRGAQIEVTRPGGVVRGRLVSAEPVQPGYGSPTEPTTLITLVGDRGAVRAVHLDRRTAVRIVDDEVSAGLTRYLSLVADDLRRDERRVSVAARGSGTRDVYVSYIAEVPVWKSTYRLLMPTDGRPTPLLQGWAVVDNTVGEDWRDVEMALVAGAPQSFVQRLSQPRFAPRSEMPLPTEGALRPMVHEAAIARPTATSTGIARDGSETIVVTGSSPVVDFSMATAAASAPDSRVVEEQMALTLPEATAQPVGELFEYRISTPVTVRKNASALVPILRSAVVADRVSLWNDALESPRPLRAMWLTNSTALTLDGGTVSIMDGGTFAGEGVMETLVPGARRLISFARDLSMSVSASSESDRRRLVSLASSGGFLVERREVCGRRVYTARNDDAQPRALVVEHPVRPGWTLVHPTAAESTTDVHRFAVEVPPSATATLEVREASPAEARFAATQLSTAQIAAYVANDGLEPAAAALLGRLVDLQRDVAAAESARARLVGERGTIGTDQERLRKNLASLKASAEERALVQRYVRQLDEHENRLSALTTELAVADAHVATARSTFDAAVSTFAVQMATPGTTCR